MILVLTIGKTGTKVHKRLLYLFFSKIEKTNSLRRYSMMLTVPTPFFLKSKYLPHYFQEYIGDAQSWNESALMEWLLENFSQPVDRIIPMWKKAFSFERHADGNPILILFTPLNPLYEQIPNYALVSCTTS